MDPPWRASAARGGALLRLAATLLLLAAVAVATDQVCK
jgi:hypothetical protein